MLAVLSEFGLLGRGTDRAAGRVRPADGVFRRLERRRLDARGRRRASAAVVLSAGSGPKRVATSRSNAALADRTGAVQGTVVTDANGDGEFRRNDRAVSVRVRR